VRFEVVDADVADLVVKTEKVARVSGVLIFEGTKRPPAGEARSRITVMATSKVGNEPGFSWAGSANVKADGSFTMPGVLPGTLSFRVGSWDQSNGLALTRIERDGVVQPNSIQIERAQQIAGLRLFVNYTNGTIRGTVKTNGTLPPGGRIIVQIAPAEESNRAFSSGEVDARGHFLLEGLAEGNYELSVIAYVPNSRGRPAMMKQLVNVVDGAVTEVNVMLDLDASPKP